MTLYFYKWAILDQTHSCRGNKQAMSIEAEAVLGRIVYSGKVVYCVKWKGLPIQNSTWESIKVLKQEPYKHLVKEFNDNHKNDKDCSEILKIVPYVEKKRRGRPPAKNKVNKPKVNKVKKNDSNELFFDDDEEVKKEDNQEGLSLKKEDYEENTKIVSNEVSEANEAKQFSTDASQEALQPQKEEKTTEVTVQAAEEMTHATSLTEPKKKEEKQVIAIHYIGKSSDNNMNYVVEFADGSLLKCNKQQIKKNYLSEYVRFQEYLLKSRPKKE